jgi:rSAM/selenodomain-associated transferase 2
MTELSIIIPCLNEEKGIHFFLSRLQGLRSQCELILVDGGSDDNTAQIAQPLVDQVIHCAPGRAMQMNVGAKMASSQILLFLHADTFLPNDAIAQIQHAFSKGYRWGRFDIRLIGLHWLLPVISYFMNVRSAITGIATGDQVIFVDKALFQQVGSYPNIAVMEDIALSKRLKKQGQPYRVISRVESSARRWIQFGIYKMILLMWWLRLQYFLGFDPAQLAEQYQRGQFWKS